MEATTHAIGEAISLALTWLGNGGLVVLFWSLDHVLLLATVPGMLTLVARARPEQRPFVLTAGGLCLLAAILVPPPIPLIVLGMTWGGVVATRVDRFNPDALRWRVIGGLALYAVAALAWSAYAGYVANLNPQQWANLFASDEAASTIAQGRSFLSTISVWGLWIIVPLGYFSLLLQGIFVHPPLARSPEQLIYQVRARGEDGGQEEAQRAAAWWPFGGQSR